MSDQLSGSSQVLALEARNVKKTFWQGPKEVRVLHDVNLELGAGKSLAIVGASGAGTSTLLHILGGLDKPDEGEVLIEGASMWALSEAERGLVRNKTMDAPSIITSPSSGLSRPPSICSSVLMTLAISFLSTLYPSWRASKTHPAEALSYEAARE